MFYCISDIHGYYDKFMALLDKIEFKATDTLYVLGDAIDRGPDSMKCLQFIKDAPNIQMLMGNHELMMLDVLTQSADCIKYELAHLWLHYNGGRATHQQYLALSEKDQADILEFVKGLPYYQKVKIGSRQYVLVHAGLNLLERKTREHLTTTIKHQRTEHPNEMVWIRDEFLFGPDLPRYTIVFGHTATMRIPTHRKLSIWCSKDKGKIGIDCGLYQGGNLSALRLDDLKEFYV